MMRENLKNGGQGGIRTHGELAPSAVFKTAAFDHSATCPHYLWGKLVMWICLKERTRDSFHSFQALVSKY